MIILNIMMSYNDFILRGFMKTIYLGLVGFLSLFLIGCASHLSDDQCINMNWHQLGFNEGSQGKVVRDLQKDTADCARFKININTDAYFAGREEGLKHFCVYDKGRELGLQGHQPPDVCPEKSKERFIKGWKSGAQDFCRDIRNGFKIGRTGKAYPQACPSVYYPGFQSEYDRGRIIYERSSQLQNQINDVDRNIRDISYKWNFNRSYSYSDSCYYELGRNKSADAKDALREINRLCERKRDLENNLFQAKVIN